MSYRTFLDSRGQRWEVWLVTPMAAERRRADRRAAAVEGVDDIQSFSERRRSPEGRTHPFRRSVDVANEYSAGLLCFESYCEKRRLPPGPAGEPE